MEFGRCKSEFSAVCDIDACSGGGGAPPLRAQSENLTQFGRFRRLKDSGGSLCVRNLQGIGDLDF